MMRLRKNGGKSMINRNLLIPIARANIALTAFDVMITMLGLSMGFKEGNHLMAWLIVHIGFPFTALFYFFSILLITLYFVNHFARTKTSILIVFTVLMARVIVLFSVLLQWIINIGGSLI